MEVAQHIGRNTVRCIMLAESENLSRGMEVKADGHGIQVWMVVNYHGRCWE